MPEENLSLKSSGGLLLRLRTSGNGPRRYPHCVGPRRMADTFIEFCVGGTWRLNDLDANISLDAGSKQLMIVPAERLHRLEMLSGGPMHSHWWGVALEDELGRDALVNLPRSMVLPAKASARAIKILQDVEQGAEKSVLGQVLYQCLCLELAAIILGHSPSPVLTLSYSSERMEQVLRYIRDHLHEPLTRRDLAKQAHLSPTRFHYVFLAATGQPPMKYLASQRVRRARQLLLSAELSSKAIGEHCGFMSATHFTRTFTKWTGTSPLAYRAAVRQEGDRSRSRKSEPAD